jgi:hypothetical protein
MHRITVLQRVAVRSKNVRHNRIVYEAGNEAYYVHNISCCPFYYEGYRYVLVSLVLGA